MAANPPAFARIKVEMMMTEQLSEPFVDIHCHLLPGIDDGSENWDQSLAMARMAVDDGFATIIVTPHQLGNYARNNGKTIRTLTAQLQDVLDSHRVPLEILPGADVRIEAEMVSRLRRGDVLTLADRRRHVLLELPHELYFPLDRLLGELGSVGMVGILSHPERNLGILQQPGVVASLVGSGCLMQVTAGSVLGAFGTQVQRLAEWLITKGLVHFIATDAHGVKSRRPLMHKAFHRVSELTNMETAVELCCRNPARVANRQQVAPGPRSVKAKRHGLTGWLGLKKAG